MTADIHSEGPSSRPHRLEDDMNFANFEELGRLFASGVVLLRLRYRQRWEWSIEPLRAGEVSREGCARAVPAKVATSALPVVCERSLFCFVVFCSPSLIPLPVSDPLPRSCAGCVIKAEMSTDLWF
jgi:hypothetical protein